MESLDMRQAEKEFTRVVPGLVESYLAEFGFEITESGGRHCDAENEHYNATVFLEWYTLETWLRPRYRDAKTEFARLVIGSRNVIIPDGIEPEARRQMEVLVNQYGSGLRSGSISIPDKA